MGKIKNMLISQQEEEELLLDEQRQKRIEALEDLEYERNKQEEFDFERDCGARP